VAAYNVNQLPDLFADNHRRAEEVGSTAPGFFAGLAAQHAPRDPWIGCPNGSGARGRAA
jgi:hypothetical protein